MGLRKWRKQSLGERRNQQSRNIYSL